jgi:hypothetical protein
MISANVAFSNTSGRNLLYSGQALWPNEVDLMPSNALLAVLAVVSCVSVILLFAGVIPKVRAAIEIRTERMLTA